MGYLRLPQGRGRSLEEPYFKVFLERNTLAAQWLKQTKIWNVKYRNFEWRMLCLRAVCTSLSMQYITSEKVRSNSNVGVRFAVNLDGHEVVFRLELQIQGAMWGTQFFRS